MQQKREALAKSSRRDIALSLEKGKIESARIKVEAGGSSIQFMLEHVTSDNTDTTHTAIPFISYQ